MTEPNVEVHEEDDAIYLFTSGTTGQAKACVIGHKTYIIILQKLQDKEKFQQVNAFIRASIISYEWRAFYFKLYLSWCYDDLLS